MTGGRSKISTARGHEQGKRVRDARNNPCPDFSNKVINVPVAELSKDILPCTRCGTRKPDEEFHKNKYNLHRRERASQCKTCRKELMTKRWNNITAEQREAHTKSNKKSYKKHKEKRNEWQREYNKTHPKKTKHKGDNNE